MDDIIIFYVSDGESWATYLINKLEGPGYELPIRRHLFKSEEFVFNMECKVQVVLMTPELLAIAAERRADFLELIPARCVVVLLGVEESDLAKFLSAEGQYDHLRTCKLCDITEKADTVKQTTALIIESFEEVLPEDDDLYSVPPTPRQVQQAFHIIPEHPVQGDNMYILLDKSLCKDTVIECYIKKEKMITTQIDNSVYSLKIPEKAVGYIHISLMSDDHVIYKERIKVESKLDIFRNLLETLTNPVQILCETLGLTDYNNQALDDLLCAKLKSKCSPEIFSSLSSLDELNFTDEKGNTTWPTLLHFAAEYNLIKFTEELLKYPDMIIAVCTENINKEYPSNIAEARGHTALYKLLVDFALEKKNDLDSGIMDPHFLTLPLPCRRASSPVDSEHGYVTMNKPKAVTRLQRSRTETSPLMKPKHIKGFATNNNRSLSECGGSPKLGRDAQAYLTKYPHIGMLPHHFGGSQEFSSSDIPDEDEDECIYNVPPPASPVIHPRFKPVVFSDTSSQRSSIISSASSNISIKVEESDHHSNNDRHTVLINDVDFEDSQAKNKPDRQFLTVNSISREDLSGRKRRNRSLQAKISSFIRKMKPRFGSTGELPRIDPNNKKTKVYGRTSDPGIENDVLNKSDHSQENTSSISEMERDSGSYSEDEHDSISPVPPTDSRTGVRRQQRVEKGLQRKRSVRVVRALAENATDAPNVPARNS